MHVNLTPPLRFLIIIVFECLFIFVCRKLIEGFMRYNNRTMPKRIVMLRDGVSESQFPIVLKNELKVSRHVYF